MSTKKKLKFSKLKLREIVERLKEAFSVKTQAELASRLAIKPQAIISAITRGEIPAAWLYKAAYEKQISFEWLRTGAGSRFLKDRMADASGGRSPVAAEKLLKAWSELGKHEKQILDRCAELLQSSDDDMRSMVDQILSAVDRHVEYRRKKSQQKHRPT